MKANLSLLLAGLLIVSAVGCSSAPKQEEPSEAALTGQDEISSTIEDSTESVSDSITADAEADKEAAKAAFLEPSSSSSSYDSTSLGSGSSGRGH